jgi:YggT family protein
VWFIWIVVSWLQAFGIIRLDPYHPVVNFVYKITDGFLSRILGNSRRFFIIGSIDIAPLVFLILLWAFSNRLLPLLYITIRNSLV